MSLWLTLHDGLKPIAGMEIIRRSNTGRRVLRPDEVSTYEVQVDGEVKGEVEHRYGDGPWVLLRKALEVITSE